MAQEDEAPIDALNVVKEKKSEEPVKSKEVTPEAKVMGNVAEATDAERDDVRKNNQAFSDVAQYTKDKIYTDDYEKLSEEEKKARQDEFVANALKDAAIKESLNNIEGLRDNPQAQEAYLRDLSEKSPEQLTQNAEIGRKANEVNAKAGELIDAMRAAGKSEKEIIETQEALMKEADFGATKRNGNMVGVDVSDPRNVEALNRLSTLLSDKIEEVKPAKAQALSFSVDNAAAEIGGTPVKADEAKAQTAMGQDAAKSEAVVADASGKVNEKSGQPTPMESQQADAGTKAPMAAVAAPPEQDQGKGR